MQKKILFAIQGEGRGHMTQAIALANMLKAQGYQICCVMVGSSNARKLPEFFYKNFNDSNQGSQTEIIQFASPNFITDGKMKGIRIWPSIYKNVFLLKRFLRSIKLVHSTIKKHQPDLIINFYEPIIGLSQIFQKTLCPIICVGHQYIYHHSEFQFPGGFTLDRISLKYFTALTAIGSYKQLAISFYPMTNNDERTIKVIPPLLRKEVFSQSVSTNEYLLIYLLNKGYIEEIISWHEKHPEIELHCFTDHAIIGEIMEFDKTLCFHKLNDKKFLHLMAGSKGFITTAGFESVCEAMYLGKPVFMVPVAGHFEQFCNSRDAFKTGAGIYGDEFDLSRMLNYLADHKTDYVSYKLWVDSTEDMVIHEIRKILGITEIAGSPSLQNAEFAN